MREAGQRWRADPSGWTRFSPSQHHFHRHSGEAVLFRSHMKSNSFTSSWDGWFIQTLAAAQHGGRLCSWWSAWRRQREAIRGRSAETRRFAALTNRELRERSLLWQISVCLKQSTTCKRGIFRDHVQSSPGCCPSSLSRQRINSHLQVMKTRVYIQRGPRALHIMRDTPPSLIVKSGSVGLLPHSNWKSDFREVPVQNSDSKSWNYRLPRMQH